MVESSSISSFTCLEINVRSYYKPHWVHTTASEKNLCVHHKQELTTVRKLPRHWNSVLNSKPNASTKLSSHLSMSIPDLNFLEGLTFSTLWHIFSRIKVPGWPIHLFVYVFFCLFTCLHRMGYAVASTLHFVSGVILCMEHLQCLLMSSTTLRLRNLMSAVLIQVDKRQITIVFCFS